MIRESEKVISESEARGLTLRLIGGIGIWHTCYSARIPPFKRDYNDIDVIGRKSESKAISEFFTDLGYRANQRFNALYGDRRLIFTNSGKTVDLFFDDFVMSHKFNFSARLSLCKPALSISDLLITKLQIVNINEKDIIDLFAIFLDHEFGNEPCINIQVKYINRYTSSEWGIYRTFEDNLTKALNFLPKLSIKENLNDILKEKILAFMGDIEKSPKTAKWKIRNMIGTRKKWYYEVSELQDHA
ncbi:MAG: hypothetical protein QXW72_06875 [Conexivisphaerales archaeon]